MTIARSKRSNIRISITDTACYSSPASPAAEVGTIPEIAQAGLTIPRLPSPSRTSAASAARVATMPRLAQAGLSMSSQQAYQASQAYLCPGQPSPDLPSQPCPCQPLPSLVDAAPAPIRNWLGSMPTLYACTKWLRVKRGTRTLMQAQADTQAHARAD